MATEQLRVGDADRDVAIDLLREAYADGRLREVDFDERASRALAADTFGDLSRILSDLPIDPARLPAPPEFGPATSATGTRARATPQPRRTAALAAPNRPRGAVAATKPTRTVRDQRRRSLAASMVALVVMVSGAGLIATAPVSDVYADTYDPFTTSVAAEVPAAELATTGEETGDEVLRYSGGGGVLTVTAEPDAFIVVRVGDTATTRTSGYGRLSVVLPAGPVAVAIDAAGMWRYSVADPAAQPAK